MRSVVVGLRGGGCAGTYTPVAVLVVRFTILGILGSIDAMDDVAGVAEDADEEERKTVSHKRFIATQWMGFKVLIGLGFGLTALAELWVMWAS